MKIKEIFDYLLVIPFFFVALIIVAFIGGIIVLSQENWWIVVVLDILSILMLSYCIRIELTKKKIAILIFALIIGTCIIASFGQIWNLFILIFLMIPIAIGTNNLIKKTEKKLKTWRAKT